MITLHQPPPAWGLPSMSPFCAKLETYLRMAKIDYQVRNGNPVAAPKGKIPYVTIDGQKIGDSSIIIDVLKQKYGDRLDNSLTHEQRATAICVQRMIEEHLYFAAAWLRWTDDESWPYVKKFFLTLLPPIIGPLIIQKFRRSFVATLRAQGMGRHTRDEVIAMAKADIDALAILLGDKPFFFGAEPTSLDATMYGFLIQLLWVPWDGPLKDLTRGQPNLVAFAERMKSRYWAQ